MKPAAPLDVGEARRPRWNQQRAEPELLAQPDAVGFLDEKRVGPRVDRETVDLFAQDHAARPRVSSGGEQQFELELGHLAQRVLGLAPARVGAAAQPAEILVSRDTLDGVESAFRLSDARAQTLKGFEKPVDVVSVDWR